MTRGEPQLADIFLGYMAQPAVHCCFISVLLFAQDPHIRIIFFPVSHSYYPLVS